MAGEMEVLFSLAGRIHVLLRREINRTVDVEWMCADTLYAQEVIKLARATGLEELHRLAERVEEVHPLLPRIERPVAPPSPSPEKKYVTSLR